jgi:putative transposase
MARQARLDAVGSLHHVIGRGIEGTEIFAHDADRNDFLNRLADLCRQEALIIYAWALMSNHFHLLVRTARQPLSQSMRRLLTGYVVNYNRKNSRYGHLFQNRYKSIICEDDPYLLELTRYIHLNPLRAGMVGNIESLSRYPWVGHSAIMGSVKREWQDVDTVLSYFGTRYKRARARYEAFVEEGIAQGRRPELVGGGLIRSLGGWSQVLSLRRRGGKIFSDERILGSTEFVQGVIFDAEQREKETLRLSLQISSLAILAEKIARGEGLDKEELRSGSRKRTITMARRLFSQIAVKKMGYSGAEVARFLGVTTSAVNRLAATDEMPDVAKYI